MALMIKTSGLSKLSILCRMVLLFRRKDHTFHGFLGGSGKAFANLSREPWGTSMLAAWAL